MNIFMIISDTFRYDNLFNQVETPARTPNLDQFAKRAISLSRIYTGSFPTVPHRTDLTSGRHTWPWFGWQDRRQSSPNHMPELLAQAGYVSQLISDCSHLMRHGFMPGFDAAHILRGQEGDLHFLHMNDPLQNAMPPEKTRYGHLFQGHRLVDLHRWSNENWRREENRFAPRTAMAAMDWLEQNYQFSPLFLWLDFFDPHEPWDPPEYMVKRIDPDYDGMPMIHPNYGRASDYTRAELQNLCAHYFAEVEMVDRWIGRVLDKIDELGLWSNSVVVFMSDHGMSLGEHNSTGKSNVNQHDERWWPLYPELSHVPFMIAAPGLEGGRTVDALLQPVDILPTLLDLVGAEVAPPQPFHGRSFAPLLRGTPQPPLHEYVISASHLRTRNHSLPPKATTPMLYTKQWAYTPIGALGEVELYDLQRDPYAETNIAKHHPEVVSDLHQKLLSWLYTIDAPPAAIEVFEQTRRPA